MFSISNKTTVKLCSKACDVVNLEQLPPYSDSTGLCQC